MSIIVEDGTLVEGANSYIDVAYLKDYASTRGITLPADEELPAKLILAMDYLDTYTDQWPGTARGELPWPRKDTDYENIPANLKKAQAVLAVKAAQGVALFNDTTSSTRVLKREKIDVLEFEYAVSDTNPEVAIQPTFPEVDALLASLLGEPGWYGRTRVMRA